MLRLAVDENLNNDILRAVLRRKPSLDVLLIQDVGLTGANDLDVLEWTANERRVLVTHDVTTITRYASQRLQRGQPMSGVFVIGRECSVSEVVDDLLLLVECSLDNEWEGRILYLPLR